MWFQVPQWETHRRLQIAMIPNWCPGKVLFSLGIYRLLPHFSPDPSLPIASLCCARCSRSCTRNIAHSWIGNMMACLEMARWLKGAIYNSKKRGRLARGKYLFLVGKYCEFTGHRIRTCSIFHTAATLNSRHVSCDNWWRHAISFIKSFEIPTCFWFFRKRTARVVKRWKSFVYNTQIKEIWHFKF